MRILLIILLFSKIGYSQINPIGGFGLGMNNSGPFHGVIEAGVETNNWLFLADFKQIVNTNIWQSYSLKTGWLIRINTDENEYISPLLGTTYHDFPSKYDIENKVGLYFGFRWQIYNISTEIGYSNKIGFFSISYQFKKIK